MSKPMSKPQNRYIGLVVPDALVEFIGAHYRTTTDKELIILIHQTEEWQYIDLPKLRHIKWLHKFIKQIQVPYTEEEKQFILDNYLKMGDVTLAKHLPNHSFKSVHKQRRIIMGLHRDKESLFAIRQKGSQNAHAARERMRQEGLLIHHKLRGVGEIYKVNCTPYWYIKPDEKRLYRQVAYHRWVWEQEVGEIPKGYIVRFKNGIIPNNYQDITIDILECVPQSEHASKVSALLGDNYVAGRMWYKARKIDIETLKGAGLIEIKRDALRIYKSLNKKQDEKSN